MPKILRNKSVRKSLILAGAILGVAFIIYLIFAGKHYFTRRGIRQLDSEINTYGPFSPLAVIALIFVDTLIPPLPLPMPLVEMAAGYLFGFWPAFFLVWISQILSSLTAYYIAKILGKKIFNKILLNPVVYAYQRYIRENGATAVFLTRSTLSSPFSLVSFLAGLANVPFEKYIYATILGTIVESALFSFVGSIIRYMRLRLWYVFILIIFVNASGLLFTYLFMKWMKPRKKK